MSYHGRKTRLDEREGRAAKPSTSLLLYHTRALVRTLVPDLVHQFVHVAPLPGVQVGGERQAGGGGLLAGEAEGQDLCSFCCQYFCVLCVTKGAVAGRRECIRGECVGRRRWRRRGPCCRPIPKFLLLTHLRHQRLVIHPSAIPPLRRRLSPLPAPSLSVLCFHPSCCYRRQRQGGVRPGRVATVLLVLLPLWLPALRSLRRRRPWLATRGSGGRRGGGGGSGAGPVRHVL